MCRPVVLILLLTGIIALPAFADPAPLPADPSIQALTDQVSSANLEAIVETLVGFHTRHTYSDTTSPDTGIGAARNWVFDRFDRAGVSAEFFHWTSYYGGGPWDSYNVLGTVPGSGPDGRLIVLGGHLDSRGTSSSSTTEFAPGADDDGSSISAMLEMGRILAGQNLEVSLAASAFTGEEQGLLGSQAYAQALYNAGTSLTAMINMDMIGHIVHPGGEIDSSTVRCYSGGPQGSTSRQLARYVKWVGEAYAEGITITLIDAIDRPGRSGDHISFYNHGFPAIRLIETAEDVAYQHGPLDIPENMSFSYARKVTKLAMGAAVTLAQAPAPPPAPEITNGGDGQSLLVAWPDTVTIPPGGFLRIAYRETNQLYWEDVLATSDPPPYDLGGLGENVEYQVSISVANAEGLPSRFGDETAGTPVSAPPPEGFETTSMNDRVHLQWNPRPETNTLEYIIERAIPGGDFAEVAVLDHPTAEWNDEQIVQEQMYLYRVRTRNTQLAVGDPTGVAEGQMASHHLPLLLVDATPDGPGGSSAPADADVDQWYADFLEPYGIQGSWDRADSIAQNVTLSDADLAPYQLAVIYADYHTASFTSDTTAVRKYLENGGKVLVTGWRLSYSLGGSIGSHHGYGPGEFLYDACGIDSIIVALPPDLEFIGATGEPGFPDLVFDAERFPYWNDALLNADAIWTDNFPPDVAVIATFNALSGASSPFHGQPVALLEETGGESHWVLVDVPLYYMTAASAEPFLAAMMAQMGMPPVGVQTDPAAEPPTEFSLVGAFPNPFNPTTTFAFDLPVAGPVELSIFNVNGARIGIQQFKSLQPGRHTLTFDGAHLPSGIYLYRLSAGEFSATGKMVLLK